MLSESCYVPPPGHSLTPQVWRSPEAGGLAPGIVARLGRYMAVHRDKRRTRAQCWTLWLDVPAQSAGFDGDNPAYASGEMWTYSDWNLHHLPTIHQIIH